MRDDRCECGECTGADAKIEVDRLRVALSEAERIGREQAEILEGDIRRRDESIESLRAEVERLRRDRADALSATTREGLSAAEWMLRAGTAERERDAAVRERDHYREAWEARAVAAGEVVGARNAAQARVAVLEGLLRMVTCDEMGGTPDLFWPNGGWEAWDERVRAAFGETKCACACADHPSGECDCKCQRHDGGAP